MTSSTFRWTLFALLFFVVPMPFFGLEGSFVPLARLLQLTLTLGVLIGLEGGGGLVGMITGLLLGHVVILGLLLYLGVWLVDRFGLARGPSGLRVAALVILAIGLVAWGVFASPYDSQFHHSNAHASLLELYR